MHLKWWNMISFWDVSTLMNVNCSVYQFVFSLWKWISMQSDFSLLRWWIQYVKKKWRMIHFLLPWELMLSEDFWMNSSEKGRNLLMKNPEGRDTGVKRKRHVFKDFKSSFEYEITTSISVNFCYLHYSCYIVLLK